MDISAINTTFKQVYLPMKYKRKEAIINICKMKPGVGLPRTTQP